MILINNSQYIEVSNVRIDTEEGVVENATITAVLEEHDGTEVETFTLNHVGDGTYRVDISPNLPVVNGREYKLITTVLAEGLQGQWVYSVAATVRRL